MIFQERVFLRLLYTFGSSVPFLRKKIELKAPTSIQIMPEDKTEPISFSLIGQIRKLTDASPRINSSATAHSRTVRSTDYSREYYLRKLGLETDSST